MHYKIPKIRHCMQCGHATENIIPAGDTHKRAVCSACGEIHYQNPVNVVGTLCTWEGQILLCKRNIAPRKGFWTFPAGFLELGESTEEGAFRETQEEAGAKIKMGDLWAVMNIVPVGQVHFLYLAQLTSPQFNPGPETKEARLFTPDQLPWEELAFRTTKRSLELYLEELKHNSVGKKMHTLDIEPDPSFYALMASEI